MSTKIKIIIAAVVALAVFAAGALSARWILNASHARELADVRLACLSAQLSFARQVTDQTTKTIQIERDLSLSKKKVEENYGKEKQRVNALLSENRQLVADLGGMRDPGKRDICTDRMPEDTAAAGSNYGAVAGARLSNPAEEFLLDFANSADSVKSQLKSCQDWILEIDKKIGFSDRDLSADLEAAGG